MTLLPPGAVPPPIAPDYRHRAIAGPSPALLIDRRIIERNIRAMRHALGGVDIHYAVKANDDPGVLRTVANEGAGFEVASSAELREVLSLGVSPRRVISSNPIKRPDFITEARAAGVRRVAIDSLAEVGKLADLAPGIEVYCRIAVDNSDSQWPLSRKHGISPADAPNLMVAARDAGLAPVGVTFHVGSQCLNPRAWRSALLVAAEVWRDCEARGIPLSLLNLGGGFPIRHVQAIPALEDFGHVIRHHVAELFPANIEVAVEPGRGLVGDSAVLATTVIGVADRANERWVYLDAGVFNGLLETIGGFQYEYQVERSGPTRPTTLAGPSCDSVDTIQSAVELPELRIGDRVFVMNAGAYTLSYASSFNGFDPPAIVFIDE